MPNPWVSLRHYQLIPVNKAAKEKEQLEKEAGGGKKEEELPDVLVLQVVGMLPNVDAE
jgi:hypothetical protein